MSKAPVKQNPYLQRVDRWTGLQSGSSPFASYSGDRLSFARGKIPASSELTAAFREDWIARLFVARPAEDATRAGWDLVGSDADADALDDVRAALRDVRLVHGRHEMHGADLALRQALIWSRLYGGAAILLITDDGLPLSEPMPERPGRLLFVRVADARYCWPVGGDVTKLDGGLPETYAISFTRGGTVYAHRSRVVPVLGEPLPEDQAEGRNGWGDSVLTAGWHAIAGYQQAARNAARAVERFATTVLSAQGLGEVLSSDDGTAALRTRLQQLRDGMVLGETVLIDGAIEELSNMGLPVQGLHQVVETLRSDVAGAIRMPQAVIFGQQMGTTRAGAQTDQSTYYERVRTLQREDAEPALRRIVDVLMRTTDGPTGGRVLDYELRPRPFSEPSEAERAESYERRTKADISLIQAGVLDPMEVRTSRFADGTEGIALDESLTEAAAMLGADRDDAPTDETEDAETYKPTEAMRAEARRGLAWVEEHDRGGTSIGRGRASDIAAGRSMSLSVARRMHSFFARHEQASKGAEGFSPGEDGYPSNGRIAWALWGGDAGQRWAAAIVERNREDGEQIRTDAAPPEHYRAARDGATCDGCRYLRRDMCQRHEMLVIADAFVCDDREPAG